MQLKLKVLDGSRVGVEVPVPGPKFFVGRDEDCHLRPGSDMVSRHHCVLLVESGYVAVRDFGSKNGTYVNDERVEGERMLNAGDTLSIGPLKFEVVIVHGIGGPKRPKVKDLKDAAQRTATAASGRDLDIADWLTEDENAVRVSDDRAASDEDSSHIRLGEETTLGETKDMDLAASTDVARTDDAATRIDAQQSPEPTAGNPPAGRFEPLPKPKAKDTQAAAMESLRMIRKQQQAKK